MTNAIPIGPARTLHLADITEQDHPERLIEIIQNVSGRISKQEREDAMVILIHRFQYLIRKITNSLFFGYDLEKYNYRMEDFRSEVFLQFLELVYNDFRIKENLEDKKLAVFANYIKIKLYRRVQWSIQKYLKAQGYDSEISSDLEMISNDLRFINFRNGPGTSIMIPMFHEIQEAILGNALNYDERVLEEMSDEHCRNTLDLLFRLATEVLTERDRQIWELYYLSGETAKEIAEKFISNTNPDKTIDRSRVLQIATKSNEKILAAYGRHMGSLKAGFTY